MNPGESTHLNIEAIKTQLLLYKLGSRNRPDIEWAAALMNSLVEAQINGSPDGLILDWGDRPDFRLTFPGFQRSLDFEVTMAASQAHQAAMRAMQSDAGITHLEPAVFSADPELSAREREFGIGRDWESLRSRGWGGTEAESQWGEFIIAAIDRKAVKFGEYGFDQLMIYDDSPVEGWINPFMATRMLRKNPHPEYPFRVNIWTDTTFVYDLYGNCLLYNVEKAALPLPRLPHIRVTLLASPGRSIFESPELRT